jgi:group I intron endonuclease
MENKVYIYSLSDPITDEVRYIGKTIRPKQRYKEHIRNSKDKKTYSNCWINSLIKDGLKPILSILEECDESNWIEREIHHISLYENLTNLTKGGDGTNGFKHDEYTKLKMSELRKGDGNNFYGKSHKEETKRILSEITKKRIEDPKFIKNLRDKGLSQWENKSDVEKLNNVINQKNRRNIKQYTLNGELIREFISLREIERELGYFRSNITPCLKGIFKQAYGFIWIYSS